ncbi:hypothetical protein C0Q70_04897 [Pomacea canaliculata]|uniref:Uncharacterized protein n=1 Tax=Pomacea canaliculata TaxID=400727 RepID=A0A2T7PJM2_POMCA|nr:hypothetical protein C0Q70_04897 [Pomacea canaliculata]
MSASCTFEALDFRFNEEVDKNASGVYSTFAFSRRAQEILEEHNTSQPIFLYLAFQAVHYPLENGGDPTEGASNWPLRGAKSTLWEGGTRGKGLLYSKNLFKKTGTTYNGLMHIVDWFPTFMTLAGGETPSGIDGVSQWDAIVNDKASPRTEFVYNIDEINQNAAIR